VPSDLESSAMPQSDATSGPIRHQTAASLAEQTIRAAILDGVYAPGDELPEVTLAEELGLSRTPVREALLALQASGLVEALRGRTARVRERTPDELMDTFELRAEVEAYTARRAAQFITADELAELWRSCDRFTAHLEDPDCQELVQENLVFHDCIHRASRNLRAPEVVRALLEMPLLYASYAWYSLERRRESEQAHRAITRALEARDGERAAALMREHVLSAGRPAGEATRALH
jgi:DNA-binding GntR family transcriptional regulator